MNTARIALLATLGVSAPWAATTIHMNQGAFDQDAPKKAVVESDGSCAGTPFSVRQSGSVVYSGKLGAAQTVSGWAGKTWCVARFDSLTRPGTYTVAVEGGGAESASFEVGPQALRNLVVPKLLGYFRSSRQNGVANNPGSRATEGDTKVKKQGDGSGKTYDVHGGWHDATGDVSKYLSHLSYANFMNPQQIPLTVWSMAFAREKTPAWLESSAKDAPVVEEGLWGADFLVRMQDPDGYFYVTVFDGWDTANAKVICAFETDRGTKTSDYQAAWREGGGMAIAALAAVSRWGKSGDYSPKVYLETAEKGYAHLKSKTVGGNCAYCDDGKENILDDYTSLMAAVELYRATGTASYLSDARARATKLAGRISPEGWFYSDDARTRPFYHAADAGLPVVALVRYLEIDSTAENVRAAVASHVSYLIEVSRKVANPFEVARQTFKVGQAVKEGFFMPHDNETGYWWQGENARLGSLAAAAIYGGRVALGHASLAGGLPDSVRRFAQSQMDWVLGSNPKGLSFMQGVGRDAAEGYYLESNGHHEGGIVNGITGCDVSRGCQEGSEFDYRVPSEFPMNPPAYSIGPWMSWRWTEQWLPHATWFLIAQTVAHDEVRSLLPIAVERKVLRNAPRFRARSSERGVSLEWNEPLEAATSVEIRSPEGRLLASSRADAGESRMDIGLAGSARGLVVVQVGSQARTLVR
ncbi:MAG: glycoside hydrolase family 9 protein [Fibrobacteria bacterium]|nr:glycoside hydrolase family 9 protein [Fibrobacteria bacterium]